MNLPYDVIRCFGEGNNGAICRKREECLRFTDRDRGWSGGKLTFAAMLCRYSDFESRIPVEGKREGGK